MPLSTLPVLSVSILVSVSVPVGVNASQDREASKKFFWLENEAKI